MEPAPTDEAASGVDDREGAVVVAESWQSPFQREDNVDSVAFWQGESEGQEVAWILATGKDSHDLLVYDATSGELVRRVGGEGEGAGEFQRPNGVMVLGDRAWVVERDNHRVQVLSLPGFDNVTFLGADSLRQPYGLTLFERAPGTVELYVTDSYMTQDKEVPSPEQLDERVKHFTVSLAADGAPEVMAQRAFGATSGIGMLAQVESLLADPAAQRLLIADEHESGMTLKVYTLEGEFTGEQVGEGHFFHEAEGVALRSCGETEGYWIATDQARDRSLFRVFDRASYEYLGTFQGELTANTDGVIHTSEAFGEFPQGAFFTVHDDRGVTAFDWQQIASAMGLSGDC
ncbi:MAG: phytase precursor [Acidobacteriota bacterium]